MLSRKNLTFTFFISTMLIFLPTFQAAASPTPTGDDVATMTIAEIYANKDSLKGKMVRVKGKVVKVSRNIMKLSWVHIKDGTGEKGTDKIIFRSKAENVEVDSEVIAQGKIITDLNLGSGYTYSILVDDATFTNKND